MQPHEGIGHEEDRLPRGDPRVQLLSVGGEIEPEAGRGNDVDREIGEGDARGDGDDHVEAEEALADFALPTHDSHGPIGREVVD